MSFLTPCLELARNLICFQKEVAVQKKDAASKYPPWRRFINSTAGKREASEERSFSLSDKMLGVSEEWQIIRKQTQLMCKPCYMTEVGK